MGTVDARVARVLEQAFRITLTDPGDGASELLYLQSLASEMVLEGAEPPLMVSGDLLERALFARLSTPAEDMSQWWKADPEAAPVTWLLRSYHRCREESRRLNARDADFAERATSALRQGLELCVNYSGLLLNPAMADMFPQPGLAYPDLETDTVEEVQNFTFAEEEKDVPEETKQSLIVQRHEFLINQDFVRHTQPEEILAHIESLDAVEKRDTDLVIDIMSGVMVEKKKGGNQAQVHRLMGDFL